MFYSLPKDMCNYPNASKWGWHHLFNLLGAGIPPSNLGGFHPSSCSFKALGSAQLMQLLLLEANF